MRLLSFALTAMLLCTLLPMVGFAEADTNSIAPKAVCGCGNGNVGSFDIYCSRGSITWLSGRPCSCGNDCLKQQGICTSYWVCHNCGRTTNDTHVHAEYHSNGGRTVIVCSLPPY